MITDIKFHDVELVVGHLDELLDLPEVYLVFDGLHLIDQHSTAQHSNEKGVECTSTPASAHAYIIAHILFRGLLTSWCSWQVLMM